MQLQDHLVDGTCGSMRELVLLNVRLYCGNKSVTMGLLLVLRTCDLFGLTVKSSLFPRPVLFVSQPTTATVQRWHVTHEKLDSGLGTWLIFTVKATVLEYFDRWLATKNPFRPGWPHLDCGRSCDYRTYGTRGGRTALNFAEWRHSPASIFMRSCSLHMQTGTWICSFKNSVHTVANWLLDFSRANLSVGSGLQLDFVALA